jgi:hypothetical protein
VTSAKNAKSTPFMGNRRAVAYLVGSGSLKDSMIRKAGSRGPWPAGRFAPSGSRRRPHWRVPRIADDDRRVQPRGPAASTLNGGPAKLSLAQFKNSAARNFCRPYQVFVLRSCRRPRPDVTKLSAVALSAHTVLAKLYSARAINPNRALWNRPLYLAPANAAGNTSKFQGSHTTASSPQVG